ncbi:hypothetical protein CP49_04590 [Bradyrhizobium valentinum]|uniref:Uncharacterized protein n=1 Tax=Bradyrhizobium valentinum TaxID=1518501 RepID=A0A0R3LB62_9BRAD|nr:hypothetical protein CP49_04590 [Bradyrhizobium valentinum]
MRTTPESIPKCLPIGDEVVEVKRLVVRPLSFRQSPNQRPCGVQDKDAAIIIVPLSGHAGWFKASAQPSCELACRGAVRSPDGVVVIGNPPFRLAAINEQQRPMRTAATDTAIVHWHEQEVGGIVTILVVDDPPQGFLPGVLVLGQAQQMSLRGPQEPRPGGQIRIVPLQLPLKQCVIRRDMLVTQQFRGTEHQRRLQRDARS